MVEKLVGPAAQGSEDKKVLKNHAVKTRLQVAHVAMLSRLQKKYKRQFIAFKENLHRYELLWEEERGLVFALIFIPLLVGGAMAFYGGRYFLRNHVPVVARLLT